MKNYVTPIISFEWIDEDIMCNNGCGCGSICTCQSCIAATIPDINQEGCFCDDDCPATCNCDYCSCN